MRKILSQTRRAAYVAALAGSFVPFLNVAAAQADDEVEKKIREEVSRRVSDAVSNRIGDRLSGGVPTEDTLANSFWVTTSYNDLESDHQGLLEHAGMRFQSDVVNVTFGGDHRFGDSWFVGLSGSYTHADTDSKPIGGGSTTQSENNSYTVSPYAAYVFDPHFFASGLFSYTYSNSESKDDFTGKTNDNSETFATELAANTVWSFGNWLLKGKAGWRFNDAHLFDIDDGNDDFVANSAVVNAEVGYRFDRFLPYFQAQYEHIWPEKIQGAKSPDPDYVFLTAGVRAAITDNIAAGVSVKAEVANRETNQLGGAAEFRIRF